MPTSGRPNIGVAVGCAVACAVLVLSLANTAGAQAPPDALATQLAAARALVDQGKPHEAVTALSALDRSDPRVAELLGVAYYHADDYARAIDALSPIISKLPGDSIERREAGQVLGLSYYLAGRLPEALPLLEETSRWATDNIQLAQVLGMAYIQIRQPDRAREALARAFGLDPVSPGARLLAAQMMIRVEFFEMADAELRQALAMDPRLPRVNFLLAENAIFRNRIEEGVAYLEKELALNPSDAMSFYRLGEAWSRRTAWDKAIPALQRSIWINPFYSAPYIVLGRAYLSTGKPDAAEGMLRHAVELDPNNKAARYLFGQVLQRLGKTAQATEQFDIASKLGEK
jgi:tetratricopeptide (TPR) repeat protein